MERVMANHEPWIRYDAYDHNGDEIGTIEQIYHDDATGRPEWVGVRTGWFGTKVTLAPMVGSSIERDDGLRLAYDKEFIKNAPNIEVDDRLSPEDERDLYRYYGFSWDDVDSSGHGYGTVYDPDRDFPEWIRDDGAMTGSEELNVGTECRGRARLRRYVVTEHQGALDGDTGASLAR